MHGDVCIFVNNMQYDLSLPVDKLYNLVEEVDVRCKDLALCTVGYGHLGDGNLHLNVVGEAYSTELLQLIEPFVYDWTGEEEPTLTEYANCDPHKEAHPYIQRQKKIPCDFVFYPAAKHNGSISAEHGLGLKKISYIQHSKSSTAVDLMRHIKLLLDPNRILNPYKTIPFDL